MNQVVEMAAYNSGNYVFHLSVNQHFSHRKYLWVSIRACRKRGLKLVATLPLGYINTEAWSSGMGVGRGDNNPTL
jgi:hypothetical protein